MAIAYDATSSSATQNYNGGGTDNASENLTASSSNQVAILTAYGGRGDGTDPSMTAMVNGNSATFIAKKVIDTGGGLGGYLYLFYYINPPTSSVQYKVTGNTTGDYCIQTLFYTGVNTTTPIDSSATGTATGDITLTDSVTASNCWLVSIARNTNVGSPTAGTGTTIRGTKYVYSAGDSNGTVGTGSQSMTWTTSGVGVSSGVICALQPPASAAARVPLKSLLGVGL